MDDSVFYSFYALIYRHETINQNFVSFLKSLRDVLEKILRSCYNNGIIDNDNIPKTTNMLFALIDGAYFKLGVYRDDKTYDEEVQPYIDHALTLFKYRN